MNLRKYIIMMFMLANYIFIGNVVAFDDNNSISVKDYGAIGDGVSDDLTAINSAISACDGNAECTVFFPNGTYLVSDSIIIGKSDIRLLGDENTSIIFPENINLEENGNRIVGVVVVKTINQDVNNVVIENLIVDANADDTHYGKDSSLGRGITVIRQGKQAGTNNYYEMNNVKIKNCTINNSYAYGISILGGERLKNGYTSEEINQLGNNYEEDFDLRKYYDYYNVNDVTIENCKVSKSRIGIRLNRVSNIVVQNNEVSDSRLENITIQVENGIVKDNKVQSRSGGCGNICLDKSEKVEIINNIVDDTQSDARDLDKSGICQNSSAGPSYNVLISNNNISGSSRGIWIKNHLKSANPHNKNDAGSRAGAGFIIKDNIIKNSSITDIRIDELLDSKVVGNDFVGKSYLYNKYNNTVNLEADDSYSGDVVGTNIKLSDNDNLVVVEPSKIKIGKLDENGNFVRNVRLVIVDKEGNVYGSYLSGTDAILVDLLLGDYILKEVDSSNEEIAFSVENDGGKEKNVFIGGSLSDNSNDVNEQIVDVTNTLHSFEFVLYIFGFACICGGFVLYFKSKKVLKGRN